MAGAKPKTSTQEEYEMLRANYMLLTAVLANRPYLVELRAECPRNSPRRTSNKDETLWQ